MSKVYTKLWEEIRPCPPSNAPITSDEAMDIIKNMKRIFKVIGVDFNMSHHALVDRLTHVRNKPPISACEFEFVMKKFISKMSKQLLDDAWDVKNKKVKSRGKKADEIPPQNYEYGITSKSTNVAIILAIQPDYKKPGGVRVNVVTTMRKRGFMVNKGEHIMVEGWEPSNIEWVEVD